MTATNRGQRRGRRRAAGRPDPRRHDATCPAPWRSSTVPAPATRPMRRATIRPSSRRPPRRCASAWATAPTAAWAGRSVPARAPRSASASSSTPTPIDAADIANQANIGFRQSTLDGAGRRVQQHRAHAGDRARPDDHQDGGAQPADPGQRGDLHPHGLKRAARADQGDRDRHRRAAGRLRARSRDHRERRRAGRAASRRGWSRARAATGSTSARASRRSRSPPRSSAGSTGQIVNTGIVAGGSELNTTNNSATVDNSPAPEADLGVAKTSLADRILVGQQTQFAFAVGNAGPSTAANATMTDTVPAGLQIITVAPGPDHDCTVSGADRHLFDRHAQRRRRARPRPRRRRPLLGHRARHRRGWADRRWSTQRRSRRPPPTSTRPTIATTPRWRSSRSPISSTSKAITPDGPVAGGPITYTITVANQGPERRDQRQRRRRRGSRRGRAARLPRNPGRRSLHARPGSERCAARRAIPVGQQVAIALDGTIADDGAGADLTNQASALPAERVVLAARRRSRARPATSPAPSADVSIRKSLPAVVLRDRIATVTFVVGNAGPSASENTLLVDRLPVGMSALSKGTDDRRRRTRRRDRCGLRRSGRASSPARSGRSPPARARSSASRCA